MRAPAILRGGFALLAALALATQAQAQVKPCWDASAIGAARVNEFQTLLMVVSLRCRALGVDLRDSYDRFITVHQGSIATAHDTLKSRFGAKPGVKGGGDYDRFLTGVANFYGMGKTEPAICGQFAVVLGELGKATATADFLASIVMQVIRDPHLDGGRCPVIAKK